MNETLRKLSVWGRPDDENHRPEEPSSDRCLRVQDRNGEGELGKIRVEETMLEIAF